MTKLERKLRRKYTIARCYDGKKTECILNIGHQYFTIQTSGPGCAWFRDQLAYALAQLVEAEREAK